MYTINKNMRGGITLMEVLISMFVLMIGLLGVGAMIPAGRYEIMQGVKADYAAMVGREAYRDMKVHGYLDPTNWYDLNAVSSAGSSTWQPVTAPPADAIRPILINGTRTNVPAVVIDPLGLQVDPNLMTMPALGRLSIPRIYAGTQPTGASQLNQQQRKLRAQNGFMCEDDLLLQVAPGSGGKDQSPLQMLVYDQSRTTILKRASTGAYSWFATVVVDPTQPFQNRTATVSVAVSYKRDLAPVSYGGAKVPGSEAVGSIQCPYGIVNEGTLTVDVDPGQKFANGIRPGQWVMLVANNYYRWYRVVGASALDKSQMPRVPPFQTVTLHGQDWNINSAEVWLFDGVIGVYEKNIRLEWN